MSNPKQHGGHLRILSDTDVEDIREEWSRKGELSRCAKAMREEGMALLQEANELIRIAKSITQPELARRYGVSVHTINSVINNKATGKDSNT